MRGFIVTNHNEGQVVNLPAGEYTYSFRVIPVGPSYTFKIDNLEFTIEDLTPGVMTPRLKCIFELNTTGSIFYLSDTLGDCIYEPQIESGIFDTTPGPHLLDFERMISEVGLEINEEFISIYAKKADVTAEINLRADAINSVVGSLSNDVNELQGNYSSIEQTVDSITSTVTNHTNQISIFQQTVTQIYSAIEDAGSGEFASIIQRLDGIELKVGAPGQEGSIHAAINAINLMVSDIDEGLSSIELTVNDISSTVSTHTGQMSVVQQSVNSISSTVSTHTGQISTIQQTVDSISSTVSTHTGQISTFQQTVDEIYLAVEDAVSGEYSSIIQRLNSIEVKVGAQGQSGSIQVAVDSVTTRVEDIDFGLAEVVVTVGSISSTVYDKHDALLSQISQDGANILIQGAQIDLRGATTINDNFKVLADGSIVANNGEFKGGLRQPFVDVSESTVENFWNTSKTSWACNFFEETPFASLPVRVIPCRPVLNGQIFRFHARRRGITLQPEVPYKFYENGASLDEIVLAAGEAIEMISVTIDNVFKSWDIIRRYKCRKYNE